MNYVSALQKSFGYSLVLQVRKAVEVICATYFREKKEKTDTPRPEFTSDRMRKQWQEERELSTYLELDSLCILL